MIRVEQFTKEHLENFSPRQISTNGKDVKEFIMTMNQVQSSILYTVMRDEEPICVFGGYLLNEKVAEVFACPSDEIAKHPLSYVRIMRNFMDSTMDVLGLNRVQAHMAFSLPKVTRYVKALGFNIEGIMEKFCADGSNAYLCARINHGD